VTKPPCQTGDPDRYFPTTGTTDKDIAKAILMDVVNEDRNAVVRGMVARGMTGPQIADALGISPSGAAQAMVRARRGQAS
jgi:predicted transcriptional regulator